MYTRVKSKAEIEAMRESGRMLGHVLAHIQPLVQPGVQMLELSGEAARELKAIGGQPAFYGYQGFPDVICISVNDAVVHGIPDDYYAHEGDIVGLDFGVSYKGMITDAAISVGVGTLDPKSKNLIEQTKSSLYAGIKAVQGRTQVGDIAAAVQKVLDKHGFGVVRDLVGHGVGHEVHEDPNIPNYGQAGVGDWLEPGMTIAIEPMATLGDWRVALDPDGWTIRTRDGSRSAHFEHTILITEHGHEILTKLPE